MQLDIGYLLIIFGLAMIALGVLVWLGVMKLPGRTRGDDNVWSFLTKLLEKAPWVAVVGLLLVFAGCKMIGVPLLP